VVPARLLPAVVESCIPAGAVCPPVVIPTSGDTTSVDPTVMFKGFGDQLQNQFGGIIKWALPIGVGLFVLSKGWELLKDLIAPDLGSEEDEDEAYKMNSLYDSQERSARVRELRNM
jgi:hypothetical protein